MSHQHRLETIDGKTLMNLSLPPLEFVVESFLPQGIHVLAGAPKIGKSWFALELCLAVASGEKFLGFNTVPSTALYLCLEDSIRRIRNRALELVEEIPATVHFALTADGIGGNLEKQIEEFVFAYPTAKLIVIDTLQKVRGVSLDNAYANDYQEISSLKALADKHNITILLVHHTRKQGDEDPMNRVSGTTGITGAVDGNYVLLKKSRESSAATLHCTGRDIVDRKLTLEFHSNLCRWVLTEDSHQEPKDSVSEILESVCQYLQEHSMFSGTPTELADCLSNYSANIPIPAVLSKRLLQHKYQLEVLGIRFQAQRSNGRRLIHLSL